MEGEEEHDFTNWQPRSYCNLIFNANLLQKQCGSQSVVQSPTLAIKPTQTLPAPPISLSATAEGFKDSAHEGYRCHPAILQAAHSLAVLSIKQSHGETELRELQLYAGQQDLFKSLLFLSACGAVSAQVSLPWLPSTAFRTRNHVL